MTVPPCLEWRRKQKPPSFSLPINAPVYMWDIFTCHHRATSYSKLWHRTPQGQPYTMDQLYAQKCSHNSQTLINCYFLSCCSSFYSPNTNVWDASTSFDNRDFPLLLIFNWLIRPTINVIKGNCVLPVPVHACVSSVHDTIKIMFLNKQAGRLLHTRKVAPCPWMEAEHVRPHTSSELRAINTIQSLLYL